MFSLSQNKSQEYSSAGCPGIGALTPHAGAARSRTLSTDKDFLTRRKDTDPDILVLKEAKAEYAKLQ
jgi:hypothetical protein